MDPTEKKTEKKSIRLDQLLKLRGAAPSGGHAKAMVQGGQVKVNGEVDTRRGRKLVAGDVVDVRGKQIAVEESMLGGRPPRDDGASEGEGAAEEPSAESEPEV